jgi:IS30 family transposase
MPVGRIIIIDLTRLAVSANNRESRNIPWVKGRDQPGYDTNKRVRRYLPPETVVLDVTNMDIRALCDRLNDTPRKCLGFRTPKEIFSQHLLALEARGW